MKKRVQIFVLGLLALSLWSVTTYAQDRIMFRHKIPGGPMLGEGPGLLFPMMLKKLDLTPEQDTRVREIMAARKDTFRSLFQQLETAHEAMSDRFFVAGPLSAEDLAPQAQTVKQLREQLVDEGLKVAVEIRGVLTPEQLAKAAQLKEKMETMHNQMRDLLDDDD